MKIYTRSELGSRPFRTPPATVALSRRNEVTIHYWGAGTPPRGLREFRKAIERIHMDERGWRGVGYNFVVAADGSVGEGAGRDIVGAHSPPHNADGIGIIVWTEKGVPTEAAKKSARDLYDQLCRQAGRKLRIGWHGRDYPTECPGATLRDWAKAGMPVKPATGTTPPKGDEFDMATLKELQEIVRKEVDRRCGDVVPAPSGYSKIKTNPKWVLANAVGQLLERDQKVRAEQAAQRKLLEALMKKLMTADEIAAAAEAGAKAALDERIAGAEVTLNISQEGDDV